MHPDRVRTLAFFALLSLPLSSAVVVACGDPSGPDGAAGSEDPSEPVAADTDHDATTPDAADHASGLDGSVPGGRCSTSAPFGAPEMVRGIDFEARGPWVASDERTILYHRSMPARSLELFMATRASADEPFGAVRRIEELNLVQDDFSGSLSSDGLSLIFIRHYTVFTAKRASPAAEFVDAKPLALGPLPPMDIAAPRFGTGGIYFIGWRRLEGVPAKLYFESDGQQRVAFEDTSGELLDAYALSSDDTVLYLTSRTAKGEPRRVRRMTRSDRAKPFEGGAVIPTLADFTVQSVSEDECVVYGTVDGPVSATIGGRPPVFRAVRGK